jgi:hypothetical protein
LYVLIVLPVPANHRYPSNIKETTPQILYTLWNSSVRNSNRPTFHTACTLCTTNLPPLACHRYPSNIKETIPQILYTLWNSGVRNSNRRPFIQRVHYVPLTCLLPPATSTATSRPNRTQQYTIRYTTYHRTTAYVSLGCDNKPNFYFIF